MTLAVLVEQVALSPFFYVEGEHFGINQGAAERCILPRMLDLFLKATRQLAPDMLRDQSRMRRVDISKQDESPVNKLPMRLQQLEDAIPVEFAATSTDQMNNIGAVEAFAECHKYL